MFSQNPENLIISSAGNDGDLFRSSCTVSSPAIAKNVLAVGATTSGDSSMSVTGIVHPWDTPSIDTVAYFSSYGPTMDGRIKPEILAPGDMVRKEGTPRSTRVFSFECFASTDRADGLVSCASPSLGYSAPFVPKRNASGWCVHHFAVPERGTDTRGMFRAFLGRPFVPSAHPSETLCHETFLPGLLCC